VFLIKPIWSDRLITKALGYCTKEFITYVKSFMIQAPDQYFYTKKSFSVLQNKLS